jgi:hypothetical protein
MQPRTIPLAAWNRAPLLGKVMFLARMLVEGEQALTAIAKLIGLIVCMSSVMSIEARFAISQQLKEEADHIVEPYDRRALH